MYLNKFSKSLISIVIIVFSIVTAVAVSKFGFSGILNEAFKNFASFQVFMDLFIASILILIWMYNDAKKNNRNFIFWCIITLLVGSFGPLFYLLFSKDQKK